MDAIFTDSSGCHLPGSVLVPTGAKYVVNGSEGNVIAAIATANGSDAATTQALANATKTSVNLLIAELKAKGLIKT